MRVLEKYYLGIQILGKLHETILFSLSIETLITEFKQLPDSEFNRDLFFFFNRLHFNLIA